MEYLVLQGVQNQNGTGDLDTICGKFKNKKQAIKFAKEIEKDTKNWSKCFNQNYLVTIVITEEKFNDEIEIIYENKIKF